MSTETQLEQLEQAIRQRAQILANNHLQTAQQQRDQILAESSKQLQQRQERETLLAKAMAEQTYRRQVQAREIKMQATLDQWCWTLVQSIVNQLYEHLKQFTQEKYYFAWLKQLFKNTVPLFDEQELIIEVNAQDYQLLIPQWETIVNEGVPKKQYTLATCTQPVIGGLLVRNKRNNIRVDNTFEGLIGRLEMELYQVIMAQLFAQATPTRNL